MKDIYVYVHVTFIIYTVYRDVSGSKEKNYTYGTTKDTTDMLSPGDIFMVSQGDVALPLGE